MSILFDEDLSANLGAKAKTCFVDSFNFGLYKLARDSGETPGPIEIPLKEFIKYVP